MLNTMRILYVEDDEDIRSLMVQRLKRHVGELITAADGKQGLALFEQHRPDLVVTDVQMPEMDGLAMASAIKAINRDTPIIVTTAYSDAEYLLQAINTGIDGYVVKPIKIGLLLETLNKHARILFNIREVERQNLELQRLYEIDRQDQSIANVILQKMMQSDGLHDPQIRCYIHPAQEFSGDFIAAARSDSGDLFIMLADVTGHGLQAAVFLLPISRVFYSMVKRERSISEIAAEMNQTMKEYAIPGRFIASTLVRLSHDKPSIEIWNGGLPTALFIDNQGNILREFLSSHPPLGIFPPKDFDSDTETYQWQGPGTLFLTTDGMIEAENPQGVAFGTDRLTASLSESPADLRVQNLISRIETHLEGKPAHDDMSCVLILCP
jgi:serine phosphatase RsbU (regulator of sigma subunit)